MKRGRSETTASRLIIGLDDQTSSSRGRSVFLTIPFYRTAFPACGNHAKARFREAGWSQWVDATLAWSLLSGVSKPNVFRGADLAAALLCRVPFACGRTDRFS